MNCTYLFLLLDGFFHSGLLDTGIRFELRRLCLPAPAREFRLKPFGVWHEKASRRSQFELDMEG